MARKRFSTTKYEIIQVASKYFMEVGYSNTSPKMIAKELDISTGNITYYFPSKEHLLLVVVEMLGEFQWRLLEEEADRGLGSATSICLETMSVAVACDESEIARDFFTAVFQSELCRNYLRKDHVERAKRIFAKECEGWTDMQFQQAELLVMGLQYAAIVPTDADIPLRTRIAGALEHILGIYQIDEKSRKMEIQRLLEKDCRRISKRIMQAFTEEVEKINEKALEQRMEEGVEKDTRRD